MLCIYFGWYIWACPLSILWNRTSLLSVFVIGRVMLIPQHHLQSGIWFGDECIFICFLSQLFSRQPLPSFDIKRVTSLFLARTRWRMCDMRKKDETISYHVVHPIETNDWDFSCRSGMAFIAILCSLCSENNLMGLFTKPAILVKWNSYGGGRLVQLLLSISFISNIECPWILSSMVWWCNS